MIGLGATGVQLSKATARFSASVSSKPLRQGTGVEALRPAWAS
jgi:hypothetical protein